MASYWCPVCGYDGFDEPPYDNWGSGNYDICSSCGYGFGVTDDDKHITHAQWRRRWIESGMKWWAPYESPAGWDPAEQLAKHDLSTTTLSGLDLNAARLQGKSIRTQTAPQDGEITLPLAGRSVVRTRTHFASIVRFTDDYSLTIEAPFAIMRGDDSREEFTPDSGHDNPEAVAKLVGLEVSTAVVSSTGALRIAFTDGTKLEVTPDGQFEPWNLRATRRLLVVSMPSGELAIWSGQA